jgi:hypothetical protein
MKAILGASNHAKARTLSKADARCLGMDWPRSLVERPAR